MQVDELSRWECSDGGLSWCYFFQLNQSFPSLLTMPNSTMSRRLGTSQITLFLCPVEGCDIRFKSTGGRTQHICAKHPNFGIKDLLEPVPDSDSESRSDDMNNRPINSSPSSHTSRLGQADEHMVVDSDPPPILASDDFLQPPMTYASPFLARTPSPRLFDDLLLPFSTSQSPAIHPWAHDRSSDLDADDIKSTGRSQATSPTRSPFLDDSSPADTADSDVSESESAFTDYHPILNGKFIPSHSTSASY